MTVYVSCDVETSGPAPSVSDLLTVGMRAIDEFGNQLCPDLYLRILYVDGHRWHADTLAWWKDQAAEARNEILDRRVSDLSSRMSPHTDFGPFDVADKIATWVETLGSDVCFVAHPGGFDWQWINDFMWEYHGGNPFGHRSLCLRSLAFGVDSDTDWGDSRISSRWHVDSEVPHHALHDAIAQAKTLAMMLESRREASTDYWSNVSDAAAIEVAAWDENEEAS